MIEQRTLSKYMYNVTIIRDHKKPIHDSILYNSNLIIRDGVVEKNNTPFTNEQIIDAYYGTEFHIPTGIIFPPRFKRDRRRKYGKGVYDYLEYLDYMFRNIFESHSAEVLDDYQEVIYDIINLQHSAKTHKDSTKYHNRLVSLQHAISLREPLKPISSEKIIIHHTSIGSTIEYPSSKKILLKKKSK